jgi:hypothetical protein
LKKLHIVSFSNPYPPDYGGVIDVYYKIKALHKAGVAIILHVFEYNRSESQELLDICEMVYHYPRKTEWLSHVSLLPYIVKSRRSDELLNNLCKDEHPILFEGLHSCYYLKHPALKNKLRLVRMHNIEHEYYRYLAKSSYALKDRIFFFFEHLRLKRFEKILDSADYIMAISLSETRYFQEKYGKTIFVGAFHSNQEISSSIGTGEFILMHGNLEVEENENAALHCIQHIFRIIDFPVIIAGKNPSDRLKKEISHHKFIVLVENPSESEMDRLQHDAHVNLCYTFQQSGLKLKLLNSLFKGKFVVANSFMTEGSGLETLVESGQTNGELIGIIIRLISTRFDSGEILKRQKMLQPYSNAKNASVIMNFLS